MLKDISKGNRKELKQNLYVKSASTLTNAAKGIHIKLSHKKKNRLPCTNTLPSITINVEKCYPYSCIHKTFALQVTSIDKSVRWTLNPSSHLHSWMSSSNLSLNALKRPFIWLVTRKQLQKLDFVQLSAKLTLSFFSSSVRYVINGIILILNWQSYENKSSSKKSRTLLITGKPLASQPSTRPFDGLHLIRTGRKCIKCAPFICSLNVFGCPTLHFWRAR